MKRRALCVVMAMGAALVLASGVALALTKTQCDPPSPSYHWPKCKGTPGSDHLKGTEAWDQMVGRKGADTIEGFAGYDILYGGPGNDKLFGGPDGDDLQGDEGDDVLKGGEGQGDEYFFGPYTNSPSRAWGNDVIVDVANSGTDPSEGNTLVMGARIYGTSPQLIGLDLRID